MTAVPVSRFSDEKNIVLDIAVGLDDTGPSVVLHTGYHEVETSDRKGTFSLVNGLGGGTRPGSPIFFVRLQPSHRRR